MVPQGGVGGMNGFELQAQADHADMIYSRENTRKRQALHLLKFIAFTVTYIFTPAELYNYIRWLYKLEISD